MMGCRLVACWDVEITMGYQLDFCWDVVIMMGLPMAWNSAFETLMGWRLAACWDVEITMGSPMAVGLDAMTDYSRGHCLA